MKPPMIRNDASYFMLLLCLLLSIIGCAHYTTHQEKNSIVYESTKRFGQHCIPEDSLCEKYTESFAITNLSCKEAIAYAFTHNTALLHAFQSLGIAKADLVQAGLLSNPHLETIFRIPYKKQPSPNIEVHGSFTISDLWQIPLRKKVAQSLLEQTSHRLLQMLNTIHGETKKAYLDCLYHESLLALAKKTQRIQHALLTQTKYRKMFGLTSDYDIANMRIAYGQEMQDYLIQQSNLKQAYIKLQTIMGLPFTQETLPIGKSLQLHRRPVLGDVKNYIDQAMVDSPRLLMLHAHLATQKAEQRLEKTKIIDDVTLGIAYERDFDKLQSMGPSLGITLPLFDTNSARIRQTAYQIQEAKAALVHAQRMVTEELYMLFTQYAHITKQIMIQQKHIIPAAKKALAYTRTYAAQMQLDKITHLKTYYDFVMQHKKLLELDYERQKLVIALEMIVGKKIMPL